MKKVLVGLGTTVLAFGASATSETETAINAAVTSGQSNYGLVVVGLIGLAALGFGLKAIMGGMRS
ncbi:hypothetical protein L4D20_04295 [Vibrio kyushuensis]|uniref:hypothetical protein n=1 Tax=Vibrio kyushuensis TaxID=2910249 RepID=UPI003D0C53E1